MHTLTRESAAAGEYHPRVVKYREGLRCLYHAEHFHSVREFHNRMVLQLHDMATVLDEESGSLSSKLKMCRTLASQQGRTSSIEGEMNFPLYDT